jgi:ATP phosphoribosyltransferase regulatory subunit
VAALLMDSARRHRQLEGKLVARLEAGGFSEVILPVVDYLDPYEELLGEVSRRELYRFVDRDGEVLALRADFTPMLARLIVPRLSSLELPLKLFYRGDVLRYQEEHAGRQREFYQLGAEIVGLPGEDAERLVLRRFLELITLEELRPTLVVMGFAGALDRLLLERGVDEARDLATALVRRERRIARSGPLREVVEDGVPADPAALGEAAAAKLARVNALCDELRREFPAVELKLDLAEFADQTLAPELRDGHDGRAYYDGLVFKAYGGRTAQAVGGGGRYDRLFQRLGAEVTAAGFAVSLDRLIACADEDAENHEDAGR